MDELEKRIQKLDEAITALEEQMKKLKTINEDIENLDYDLEEDCEEEIREIMKEYLMLDFIGEE
ncbi:hypothetical protein [Streptobacillus canis]|uniref:hypothetical protein n=1 Tax=Streptobacillus canis TaxID=2678686 RepID=UPI0012E246BF|nr:hypothetical protein [Streptobacillus canis]